MYELSGLAGTYTFDEDGFLPVELVRFSAAVRHSVIQLSWQTASEINNDGFEIQRSSNAQNWQKIAFADGMGTTTEQQNYQYTDHEPFPGVNYYRLKQMDYDGQFEYSSVVVATTQSPENGPRIFPNPSTGFTNVMFEVKEKAKTTILLFDLMGRQVKALENTLDEGINTIPLDLSELASGIYMMQIQSGEVSWQHRLMVE